MPINLRYLYINTFLQKNISIQDSEVLKVSKRVDMITEIVQPIADEMGLELVDVEIVKEAENWFLRIYIDKDGGILIEDCESLSKKIDPILDAEPQLLESYDYLEVSSPGAERQLKKESDFIRYEGNDIEVKTYKPVDGKKAFEGQLIGLIENKVVIKTETGQMEFLKEEVSSAKLVLKL